MRAVRTPIDDKQDQYSLESGLDCSNLPDLARQEYKEEADVNVILAKFGVHAPSRVPVFGEADFDTDLQTVYAAANQLQDAWQLMSPELRLKYPTWEALITAMADGKVKITRTERGSKVAITEAPEPEKAPAPPTPPTT